MSNVIYLNQVQAPAIDPQNRIVQIDLLLLEYRLEAAMYDDAEIKESIFTAMDTLIAEKLYLQHDYPLIIKS